MATTGNLKADTSVRGIIRLTLPISLAKLIPELNYLINAVFLGHLGTKELGLAGVTGVYYLVFSAIGYGLNNALLAIMSRRAGEENRDQIYSTLWHGLVASTGLAVVFVTLTWLFIHPVLQWTGVRTDGASMAANFLCIRLVGLFFLYGIQMQNAFLISIQQTRFLVLIALIQSSVNILLDYGLIFGHFGLPAMGFYGAAWASVLSELTGVLTVFGVILSLNIRKNYGIRPNHTINTATLKLVLSRGFPLMSQLAISTGAWWVFYLLVSRQYNYEGQAVSQAMRNIFGLSGVFSWAFGSSANTILSNTIGQGRQEEIFIIIRKLSVISLTGMAVFVTLLNLFPQVFLSVFGQGGGFIEAGTGSLRVVSAAMLILCVGVIWLNTVVATGKTKVVFWIEFWGITAYLVYVWLVIEVWHLPLEVAWMSEWLYWVMMLVPSYLYMKWGNWRKGLSYDQ